MIPSSHPGHCTRASLGRGLYTAESRAPWLGTCPTKLTPRQQLTIDITTRETKNKLANVSKNETKTQTVNIETKNKNTHNQHHHKKTNATALSTYCRTVVMVRHWGIHLTLAHWTGQTTPIVIDNTTYSKNLRPRVLFSPRAHSNTHQTSSKVYQRRRKQKQLCSRYLNIERTKNNEKTKLPGFFPAHPQTRTQPGRQQDISEDVKNKSTLPSRHLKRKRKKDDEKITKKQTKKQQQKTNEQLFFRPFNNARVFAQTIMQIDGQWKCRPLCTCGKK